VLKRALLIAFAAVLLAPAAAFAGTFTVSGSTLVYQGDDGVDQIAGFDTGTSYRFTRFGNTSLGGGAGCTMVSTETIDCTKTGVALVVLGLEGGDDVASIAASVKVPVRFDGGDGNDGLFGGGGVDTFLGGAGNDNIVSRDGQAEQVDCGPGSDTAISDDSDTRGSCEEIEGDADNDGVRRPADCDDTKPGIRPGIVDIPDDGIDQDCSGADATNLDRDGDGYQRPVDCDDTNAKVHPKAREVVGNSVDENCDGDIVPFRGIGGIVRNLWTPVGARTGNVRLQARQLPARTRIELSCTGGGCPRRTMVRTVRSIKRPVDLHSFFKRSLARGARVELRLTRSGRIGRVLRYQMTSTPGVPKVDLLCRPPGGRTRAC
jgi:hypothetical protein